MRIAYKCRLYPTQGERAFLTEQWPEACGPDNCAHEERPDAWKTWSISSTYSDQTNQQLRPLRAEGLTGLANYSCCQEVFGRLTKTLLQLTE